MYLILGLVSVGGCRAKGRTKGAFSHASMAAEVHLIPYSLHFPTVYLHSSFYQPNTKPAMYFSFNGMQGPRNCHSVQ